MLPLWPQYFGECLMVVLVVDVACNWSIAPAAVELMELMQHPQLLAEVCTCKARRRLMHPPVSQEVIYLLRFDQGQGVRIMYGW